MQRSEQPVALITGASRGIGEATARELARRGYALVLAARSSGPLTALAAELAQSGTPALAVPTDMRNPDDVQRLARVALAQFGRVHALINNAGVGSLNRTITQLSDDNVDEMLAVNLTAPIALTRHILPAMLERQAGAIVFIGSVAGRIAIPGSAVYSTTKFGLRAFALALRREVGHRGIRVTLVAPGFIDTAMNERLRGVPKAPVAPVARAIANAVEHPKRELITPAYYQIPIFFEQLLPGIADWVLRLRIKKNKNS